MPEILVPVILCGGAGSRLWPVSRELHPKPFIRLADGQSLLQKAFVLASAQSGVNEIVIATNREHFFKIEDEFRELMLGDFQATYILEPCGRNTAPAIASAATYVFDKYGKDATMLVLAADHLIANHNAFRDAVNQAVKLAKEQKLVTFGITPNGPETGYGYIETDGNKALRFHEKPSEDKAKQYVASGNFLWNSGIFCFRAGAILDQLKHYSPELLALASKSIEQSKQVQQGDIVQMELDAESYSQIADISIDYAVMEKSSSIAVVPCNIGWSDVGSWNVMGDLNRADTHGNTSEGEVVLHNVENCYIRSHDRMIGAVGVHDLVVIDTPDALLVANKNCTQDVKHIYSQLKLQNHETHRLHRTVYRPWGSYTVLEEGPRFKIKRIEVKPGASLSLQMHHHRSEHWVVVTGMAKIINNQQELFISANESTYIPAGNAHRLANPGKITLVMIEVQIGDYLGEDDIIRLQDDYGRQ